MKLQLFLLLCFKISQHVRHPTVVYLRDCLRETNVDSEWLKPTDLTPRLHYSEDLCFEILVHKHDGTSVLFVFMKSFNCECHTLRD